MPTPYRLSQCPLVLSLTTLVAIAGFAHAQHASPPDHPPPPPAADGASSDPASVAKNAAQPQLAPRESVPPPPAPPRNPPALKIGGLWYLSYQGLDADPSAFVIKRGYINIETSVLPYMSARITPDVKLDATGDLKVRLKYAYAKFHVPDLGVITRPEVEVGVAHMPWLDFEERINLYRMQDTMFMERNGLFNSADLGITFAALLGGVLSEDYQKNVSSSYPGRWGSFAVGVYNGGGYYAAEKNDNKVLEGRASLRPLPDLAPGLQVSVFALSGKGNTAASPDWRVLAAMASYQSRYLVLTGQWVDATGNQKGNAVTAQGRALEGDGWSVFAEGRMTPQWSVIVRWEKFDPNGAVPGDENHRSIAGLAYHLGKGNTVLLDLDRVSYQDDARPSQTRLQLTLQVRY